MGQTAAISDKLKALLAIAGKVQQGGKNVTAADVERARLQGATDLEIGASPNPPLFAFAPRSFRPPEARYAP